VREKESLLLSKNIYTSQGDASPASRNCTLEDGKEKIWIPDGFCGEVKRKERIIEIQKKMRIVKDILFLHHFLSDDQPQKLAKFSTPFDGNSEENKSE